MIFLELFKLVSTNYREVESMDGIAAEFGGKLFDETTSRWEKAVQVFLSSPSKKQINLIYQNTDLIAIMICDPRFAFECKILASDEKNGKTLWKKGEKRLIELSGQCDVMVLCSACNLLISSEMFPDPTDMASSTNSATSVVAHSVKSSIFT